MKAIIYLLRPFIFILFSIFSISYATVSYAAEAPVIGLVVWVTGTMKAAKPNAAPRVLTRRSPIYEADTITTGADGSGEIVFTDNSIISVRNNTTLEIAKFNFGKSLPAKSNSETLNLIKGGFRTITGAITKVNPQGYTANTPVANIGVAGTIYSAYFDLNEQSLYTKLDRGVVHVSNKNGTITLKQGAPAAQSKCPADLYGKVVSGQKPDVVCEQPEIFLTDPPLIPVGFPSSTGQSVGSFCVS